MCEKELPPNRGEAAEFEPRFPDRPTLFRLSFSFNWTLAFSGPEDRVDVAGVPVKELVAILCGNAPSVRRWVDPQLAE